MTEHIMTGKIEQAGYTMELRYRMFEHPGEGKNRFGLSVENLSTGESSAMWDITSSKAEAEQLLSLLARGQVTLVNLRDVVEDFIAR